MKEITLLHGLIEKLNVHDFDLKAWKQYAVTILARIFGADNPKIRMIEQLEVDYSSWSLRDASGRSSNLDTCKKLGKEILLAAIDELSVLGIPENKPVITDALPIHVVVKAFENELKVSEYKGIADLINSTADPNSKKNALLVKLNVVGRERIVTIVADILADENLRDKF